MTFEEWIVQCTNNRAAFTEWRDGQFWFNCLYDVRPELADMARGVMDLDPFYVDANISRFLEYVGKNW